MCRPCSNQARQRQLEPIDNSDDSQARAQTATMNRRAMPYAVINWFLHTHIAAYSGLYSLGFMQADTQGITAWPKESSQP